MKAKTKVPGEMAAPPMTPTEQTLLACVQSLRRSVEALHQRVERLERDRDRDRSKTYFIGGPDDDPGEEWVQ